MTDFPYRDVEAFTLDARLVHEASEHPSVAQLKGPLPRSLRPFLVSGFTKVEPAEARYKDRLRLCFRSCSHAPVPCGGRGLKNLPTVQVFSIHDRSTMHGPPNSWTYPCVLLQLIQRLGRSNRGAHVLLAAVPGYSGTTSTCHEFHGVSSGSPALPPVDLRSRLRTRPQPERPRHQSQHPRDRPPAPQRVWLLRVVEEVVEQVGEQLLEKAHERWSRTGAPGGRRPWVGWSAGPRERLKHQGSRHKRQGSSIKAQASRLKHQASRHKALGGAAKRPGACIPPCHSASGGRNKAQG